MTQAERNALCSRNSLLMAARNLFSRSSYDSVGLRDIAKDAHVDAALISRYFGSKEALFGALLCDSPLDCIATLESSHAVAEALAQLCTSPDQGCAKRREQLMIVTASLASTMRPRVEAYIDQALLSPLAEGLEGQNRRERASAAICLMLASTLQRQGSCQHPLLCASNEQLSALFEAALTSPDIGSAADAH